MKGAVRDTGVHLGIADGQRFPFSCVCSENPRDLNFVRDQNTLRAAAGLATDAVPSCPGNRIPCTNAPLLFPLRGAKMNPGSKRHGRNHREELEKGCEGSCPTHGESGARGPAPASDLLWSCHDTLGTGTWAPEPGEPPSALPWTARFYGADSSTRLPVLPHQPLCPKKMGRAPVTTNLPGTTSTDPQHYAFSPGLQPTNISLRSRGLCLPWAPAACRFLPSFTLICVSLSQAENHLGDTECFPYGTHLIKY